MESLFISKNWPLWLVCAPGSHIPRRLENTWSGQHEACVEVYIKTLWIRAKHKDRNPPRSLHSLRFDGFPTILQNHNISQQYSWKMSPIGAPESSAVLWRINNACDITSPVSRVKHYWRGRFIRRCLTLLINTALTSFRRSAGTVSLSKGGANLLNSTNHTLQTPSVLVHYRLYYIIKQLLARVWKITSTTTA